MKQPDLRAKGEGRAGEVRARRADYRAYRESNVHAQFVAGAQPAFDDQAKNPQQAPSWLAECGGSWVSTPTGERVLAGLRYAQMARDIVVIYGGAGVGKTSTIEHYQRTAPAVFYVALSPATGGLTACLQEISQALGLRIHSQQVAFMHRSICAALRGANALLVIDESQDLNMQALDQVRCIHDQSRAGVALVGNEQVYAQLAGGSRAAYLDRLYSRIGKRIHLKRTTEADANAIIAAWGFSDRPSCDYLRQISAKPGGLRVLSKVVRLANAYALAEARRVNPDDIEAAWFDLGAST